MTDGGERRPSAQARRRSAQNRQLARDLAARAKALREETARLVQTAHAHVADRRRLTAVTSQLESALETRGVIERAKGILMVARRCSAAEAFALLQRQSQHENVKLHAIARRVVDSVEQSVAAGSSRNGQPAPMETNPAVASNGSPSSSLTAT
jgi:hypothetical protein